jgi:hypothetical protein
MQSRRDNLDWDELLPIWPEDIDALRAHGIELRHIFQPTPIRTVRGVIAEDARLDLDDDGRDLLCFLEPDGDIVAWDLERGLLGSWEGGFCLGRAVLANPATCMLGGCLNIFADVFTWLHFRDRGIVVIDWSRTWAQLSTFPRIAITPELLGYYEACMRPPAAPELFIIPLVDPLPERDAAA